MAILRISLQLKKLIEKYCCVKDTEGMSPAKVYNPLSACQKTPIVFNTI